MIAPPSDCNKHKGKFYVQAEKIPTVTMLFFSHTENYETWPPI